MTRCMLMGMSVPRKLWPEAAQYAVYILNRSPATALGDVTPEERWSNHKPSVAHIRTFGCIAFALVSYEKRTKLDEKSVKCVLMGVSKESKAYRLYNPDTEKIVISKDVKFDETKGWDWEESKQDSGLFWEEIVEEKEVDGTMENEHETEEENGPRDEATDTFPAVEEVAGNGEGVNEGAPTRGPVGRSKRAPVWMKDYVAGHTSFFIEEEDEIIVFFTASHDPESFEEAAREERWREAMIAEIKSIEENETWELVELPAGAKVIGVKWVFKTKLNESGEVDKYKARLVAKGYHQRQGVDFQEVFAPVARCDTIRAILALAAQRSWKVLQLDVKSSFLNGELNEDVYIAQSKGFEEREATRKVYKLNKALYGLKQAPRAWYNRIEGYFMREGFEKCYFEHTLFVKKKEGGILIISLYVDDLIYTGNSDSMLEGFKKSMMEEFAMTDLGRMRFFLGVEVVQDNRGIFINQHKYAEEILKRFGMEECNPVRNPMVPGQKLTKEGTGAEVSSTGFKQLVGSLRYLTVTRPDIMFPVNLGNLGKDMLNKASLDDVCWK